MTVSLVKPPIIRTAVTAWGDAFRVIRAMPLVISVALVFLLMLDLWNLALLPPVVTTIILGLLKAVLLSPLAILVHRYVLLGEVTNRYPLDPWSGRYIRFASFAILVNILWAIPSIIRSLALNPKNAPVATLASNLVDLVSLIAATITVVVIVVVARRAILFPAIAIDAPGASWSNARHDTKGSSWRVVFIFFCTALPPLVIVVYPLYFVLLGQNSSRASLLAFSVILSIMQVFTLCAFAAAASHIFKARSDYLMRPDQEAKLWPPIISVLILVFVAIAAELVIGRPVP